MADRAVLHAWCRARVLDFLSGLLDELEEERFRRHVAECRTCREEFDPLMEQTSDSILSRGHIPSAMLARWNEAQTTLSGLQRALVRHHLERCSECREDIELLGFEPALEHVPGLEPRGDALALLEGEGAVPDTAKSRPGSAAARTLEPTRTVRIVRAERRRRPWAGWVIGSWASAASLVALFLIAERGSHIASVAGRTPESSTTPLRASVATRSPALSLAVIAEPTFLRPPLRGEAGDTAIVKLSPGASTIALRVRPLDVPDNASVLIEVLAADGRSIASASFRQHDLYPRRSIVLTAIPERLRNGMFVLRLRTASTESARGQEIAYPFKLQRAIP